VTSLVVTSTPNGLSETAGSPPISATLSNSVVRMNFSIAPMFALRSAISVAGRSMSAPCSRSSRRALTSISTGMVRLTCSRQIAAPATAATAATANSRSDAFIRAETASAHALIDAPAPPEPFSGFESSDGFAAGSVAPSLLASSSIPSVIATAAA
jgi:hypothetical protein